MCIYTETTRATAASARMTCIGLAWRLRTHSLVLSAIATNAIVIIGLYPSGYVLYLLHIILYTILLNNNIIYYSLNTNVITVLLLYYDILFLL